MKTVNKSVPSILMLSYVVFKWEEILNSDNDTEII